MVGSFLNVLIARLPYEKSIVWPSSRCFGCYRPIRLLDNVPVLGYLRLRGRCRSCGAAFSARYLWVEVGTGLVFLALFLALVFNWQNIPALRFDVLGGMNALPPWQLLVFFAYYAFLLSGLIAAAVIDAEHRIIPPLIPYAGVVVGVAGGALLPWPWPHPSAAGVLPPPPGLGPNPPWALPELWGLIPLGLQPWPFWGPTFAFAPPGSFQLGLLNGLIGALAGSLVVRAIKWLFEVGFGREALGLGDADLLMMAGAFVGWQIAVLSLFVGAVCALGLKVLGLVFGAGKAAAGVSGPADARELPFGPGLAVGVVVTWAAWPWLGKAVQFVFFDAVTFGISVVVLCVGMLAAGVFLRRPEEEPAEAAKV
jgi:leader peptidase (prepilin peptidase)/N-methyltransferase